MPIQKVPGTNLTYYLICIDGTGAERADDSDSISGSMISLVLEKLAQDNYTDVFLMSHGWMGDVPAAVRQYNNWTAAMVTCEADLNRAQQVRQGFKPLLVGFHWPSLPFGDEEFGKGGGESFDTANIGIGSKFDITELLEAYANRIADTPAARKALESIFAAAAEDIAPPQLTSEVVEAYRILDKEAGLGAGGPADSPSGDREAFDPETAYQNELARSDISYGNFVLGPILGILRSLSFFKMKDRARRVGETSVRTLLARMQQVTKTSENDVRFHLMGHSFGCIVISAALAGQPEDVIADPVHSVLLAQGAVSFWSYCNDIPVTGQPGYFRRLIDGRRVAGALITTQSAHDTAVCKAYPIACFVRGDVDFIPGTFPKYGALGAFGVRGPGIDIVDLEILEVDEPYAFEPGKIYNIDSSRVIKNMESVGSGAHNDIAHPQVAHAMWSAVLL